MGWLDLPKCHPLHSIPFHFMKHHSQTHRARQLARRSYTALFLRAVCTYPRMLQLLLAYLGFVAIVGKPSL